MSWHIGDVWPLTMQVINTRTNALGDPASISVTVTKPNASVEVLTPTRIEEGVYELKVPLTEGDKTKRWKAKVVTLGNELQAAQPASILVEPDE